MLHMEVLAFEPVDETAKCDHLNESHLVVHLVMLMSVNKIINPLSRKSDQCQISPCHTSVL